jgi:hypothetical protein
MKLEPIIQLPTMMTASWRRFGVHVFEGELTLDDITRLDAAGSGWHKKNPGKVVELVIIFPSEARMSGDERSRLGAVIKRGLAGAMHRSILTGLQMFAPPPHPAKIFGATAEAVTWLAPHVQGLCGADATRDDLMAAVDDLCGAFKAVRSEPPKAPS